MIVVQLSDSRLRKAVRRAARPDEDVVAGAERALAALDLGFPRLVVKDEGARLPPLPSTLPVLELDDALLRRWDAERRSGEMPTSRVDHASRRLESLLAAHALEATWVDKALAELARSVGGALPDPLRGFGRRVMEEPAHYTTLHAVAEACELSRGALKARFRRRGLASPYTYQRWFRILAVAHLLSDRSLTVATVARRTGFTSDGNLCRMMATVCGMTPTELRTVHGWNRLLITFAWLHLTPEAIAAWRDMEALFALRVA